MPAHGMRLISWNVAHRDCWAEQVTELGRFAPDLVALQEVTPGTAKKMRQSLKAIGLPFVADSLGAKAAPTLYGVLIASRWNLAPAKIEIKRMRLAERLLAAKITTSFGSFEFATAFVESESSDAKSKLHTLEGIYKAFARNVRHAQILCGDFNTPQRETPGGLVVTWGQHWDEQTGEARVRRTWHGMPGERYDRAERDVLKGLERFDLRDVYRLCNGYVAQEYSWYPAHHGRESGRRFDHIFAANVLRPTSCRYLHTFQDIQRKRLSDHSPIEATFEPRMAAVSHG